MSSRAVSRRRGRPAIPPARRRTSRLLLRLTAAEFDAVRRRAALARLPTAAYARAAALRTGPPSPVPVLNVAFVGELGRLANNLNQLTKLVHQGRMSPLLLPCLEAILAEVRKLRRELIGLDSPAAREPDPEGETGGNGGADPGA